ncbi:hypothetical protein ACA910_021270 [Epithemia clementina (nom. ined.)]
MSPIIHHKNTTTNANATHNRRTPLRVPVEGDSEKDHDHDQQNTRVVRRRPFVFEDNPDTDEDAERQRIGMEEEDDEDIPTVGSSDPPGTVVSEEANPIAGPWSEGEGDETGYHDEQWTNPQPPQPLPRLYPKGSALLEPAPASAKGRSRSSFGQGQRSEGGRMNAVASRENVTTKSKSAPMLVVSQTTNRSPPPQHPGYAYGYSTSPNAKALSTYLPKTTTLTTPKSTTNSTTTSIPEQYDNRSSKRRTTTTASLVVTAATDLRSLNNDTKTTNKSKKRFLPDPRIIYTTSRGDSDGNLPSSRDPITTSAASQQQAQSKSKPRNSHGGSWCLGAPAWLLLLCALLIVALVALGAWSVVRMDDYKNQQNNCIAQQQQQQQKQQQELWTSSNSTLEWQARVQKLEAQVQSLEDKVQDLELENQGWQQDNQELNQTVQDLTALNIQNQETQQVLQSALDNLTWQWEDLSANHSDCEALNGNLTRVLEELREALQTMTEQNQELQNWTQSLTAEKQLLQTVSIPLLRDQLVATRAVLNATQNDKAVLEHAVTDLNANLTTAWATAAAWQADHATCQANYEDCQATVADLNQTLLVCQDNSSQLVLQYSDLSQLYGTCDEDRDRLNLVTVPGLQNEITSLNDELQALRQQTAWLTQENEQYEALNGQLNETVLELELQYSDLSQLYGTCDEDRDRLNLVTVPGLQNQISSLNDELQALRQQTVRLTQENEQYEALNGQLNETVLELEALTDQLNDTAIQLSAEVDQLNDTVVELEQVRADLTTEVNRYQVLTQELNATNNQLTENVANLTNVVDTMTVQNQALQENVQTLTGQVNQLQLLQINLEDQVDKLQNETQTLTTQVQNLTLLVADLETVSTYINQTSASLEDSFDAILQNLSNAINLNRALALDVLKNLYADATDFWDCAISDLFGEEDWLYNRSLPIGTSTNVELVLDEVQERVLNVLCLNRTDYSRYLEARYGAPLGSTLTFTELREGTGLYSTRARNYYFPLRGQPGLTDEQWEAAEYACENLDPPFLLMIT